jgi:hypothetical protein
MLARFLNSQNAFHTSTATLPLHSDMGGVERISAIAHAWKVDVANNLDVKGKLDGLGHVSRCWES